MSHKALRSCEAQGGTWVLRVVPTPALSKKYAAVFLLPNGRQRTVRFGTASNCYVSNKRKTARDRAACTLHGTA